MTTFVRLTVTPCLEFTELRTRSRCHYTALSLSINSMKMDPCQVGLVSVGFVPLSSVCFLVFAASVQCVRWLLPWWCLSFCLSVCHVDVLYLNDWVNHQATFTRLQPVLNMNLIVQGAPPHWGRQMQEGWVQSHEIPKPFCKGPALTRWRRPVATWQCDVIVYNSAWRYCGPVIAQIIYRVYCCISKGKFWILWAQVTETHFAARRINWSVQVAYQPQLSFLYILVVVIVVVFKTF